MLGACTPPVSLLIVYHFLLVRFPQHKSSLRFNKCAEERIGIPFNEKQTKDKSFDCNELNTISFKSATVV